MNCTDTKNSELWADPPAQASNNIISLDMCLFLLIPVTAASEHLISPCPGNGPQCL